MSILSKRIERLSESETLAMAQRSRELKAKGHDVINLSLGEPDFFTPDYIKEAAKKGIDDNYTFYTPVNGYMDLREAICKKLKRDNNLEFTPDQIVASTGAKQAIANSVLCLTDPGDEIIIPAPYWVSYKDIADIAEARGVYVQAGIENDFKITAGQLEKAITPKTKLFIFSSPCNPTGSVYSKQELKKLAEVFERNPHVYIISDEIYELINFSGKHESIAQFESIRSRVIIINGVSKGFCMTGWRLGYLAADKEIAKACTKLQGQFTSGAAGISQRAALKAMETDPVETKQMLEKFKQRRDMVLELLKDIKGMKTNTPNGAFYIFPDISAYLGKSDGENLIAKSKDLCMYILNSARVAVVPGDAFGNPNCIRISYATSEELLKEAISRIKTALERLV